MATLAEIQKNAPNWWWVHCTHPYCSHKAPVPLAPLVIGSKPGTTPQAIARRFRCTACGTKGATFTAPSWSNMVIGWQPFPVDRRTAFHSH